METVWERMTAEGAGEGILARGREIRLKLDYLEADRLILRQQEDDAAFLLARIKTETRDPALRQQAEKRLALLGRVEEYNRFAELYTEASRLLEEVGSEAARSLVDELRALAHPGLQTRAVEALEDRLASPASEPETGSRPRR